MADGKVIIDTQIDTSGAESGISRLNGTLKGITAGYALAKVGEVLFDLGKKAISVGIDFESAFAGVKKTVNASSEQLATLQTGIRNMAKEMPTAATEIAGVSEAAGQLGIKTDNILGFTKTMVMLGDSTNMSAEEAATALARLANITGMPQSEFDRLGSTIVALGNNMATTESDIVNMSMRLAGTGHQVGMSEAQIMSFSAALSSVGIEAEAGGTAFSKVMSDMQLATETGGKKLDDFAKVAGMSADQFKKAFKEDASQAIVTFIQGLGNMQTHGKSSIAVLKEMGINDVRVKDALLRASGASGVFTNALKIGNDAWKQNTALTNEANQRYETTASKIEILKNNFKDLGISIFQKFEQPMKKALDIAIKNVQELSNKLSSGDLSQSIENMAKGFGNLLIVVSQLATNILPPLITILGWILSNGPAIAAAIIGVTTALKTFSIVNGIIKSLQKAQLQLKLFEMVSGSAALEQEVLAGTFSMLEIAVGVLTGKIKLSTAATALATKAQELWNTVMLMNPIGLIIAAIAGLVAAFFILWNTSEGFRNFWIGLWNSIKAMVSTAVEEIKIIFISLGAKLIEVASKIEQIFTKLGESIKNSFGAAIIGIGEKAKQIWSGFVDLINQLASKFAFLGDIAHSVAEKAKQAWNGFIDILHQITSKFAFLGDIAHYVGNSILRSFTTARGIALTFVGVLANIGLKFIGITGPIGLVASLLITLTTSFLKISGFTADGITKTFNDLGNKISQVGDILAKNIPKFIEAGTKIVTNIADGIVKNLPKLIDTATKIITNITNGITAAIPKIIGTATKLIDSFAQFITINLPKLIDSGIKIIDKIVQGITNAIPKIIGTATKVIDSFSNFIVINLPKLIDSGIKILDKLIQGITNALPKLTNAAVTIVTKFTQSMLVNLPKLIDSGIKIIDKIVQGITNAIPKLLPVMVTVIQTILTNLLANLPKILESGGKIIVALIAGIGLVAFKLAGVAVTLIITIAKSLLANLPKIIEAGVKLIMALIQGIVKILPQLVIAGLKIIMALVKALIINLPKILAAGAKILLALIKGIAKILPQLIIAALKIIMTLAKALIMNLPKILAAGVKILLALIKGIGKMSIQLALLGTKLMLELVAGIGKGIIWVVQKGIELGSKFVNAVITWFCQLPGRIWTWLVDSIGKVAAWGGNLYNKAIETGSRFISGVITWFCQLPGRIWTWLVDSIGKVAAWGGNLYNKAIETGSRFISGIITWFCQLPGRIWTWLVNSISKVSEWGGNLFRAGVNSAKQLVTSVVDTVKSIPGRMVEIGKNIVEGVWNGITGAAGWLGDKVSGFFGGIVDKAKGVLGIHSPSRVMAAQVGKWIPPGIGQGIKDAMPDLSYQMNEELIGLTGKMKATVNMQSSQAAKRFYNKNTYSNSSRSITNNQGVTQNITFNKPVESPVETARRIKQTGRSIVFG